VIKGIDHPKKYNCLLITERHSKSFVEHKGTNDAGLYTKNYLVEDLQLFT